MQEDNWIMKDKIKTNFKLPFYPQKNCFACFCFCSSTRSCALWKILCCIRIMTVHNILNKFWFQPQSLPNLFLFVIFWAISSSVTAVIEFVLKEKKVLLMPRKDVPENNRKLLRTAAAVLESSISRGLLENYSILKYVSPKYHLQNEY